jgi:hypothetical protein
MPIILPVEFSIEVVTREDGTTYERDLITTTHPDGTKSARVATLLERVEIFMPGNPYAIPVFNVTDQHRERWPRVYEQFRESIEQTAEVVPSHEELLAEWRLTHPKPTAAQVAEVIAKRDAGEKAEAEAKPATPPAPATAPVPAAVVSAQP